MADQIGTSQPRTSRQIARSLAGVLDRAIARRQWDHAERVAETAARLADDHPMLRERLARLRLAQGDAEAALSIIEADRVPTSSLRLLRAACLLQLGRRDEAHLDLRQWATKASAPIQARLLLGLLDWHIGDIDAAHDVLHRNLRQVEDAHTLAALMLMSAARGDHEQTVRWAARLRQACASSAEAPLFDVMLQSLGLEPIDEADVEPARHRVETLAMELLAAENAIPALVEAQKIDPRPAAARLLTQAIECVLPDLDDRAAGYAAIAELMEVLGDDEAALEWARRGVVECPMSATLARRARELESDPIQWHGRPARASADIDETDGLARGAMKEGAA